MCIQVLEHRVFDAEVMQVGQLTSELHGPFPLLLVPPLARSKTTNVLYPAREQITNVSKIVSQMSKHSL